jgi:hypothetical protein
LHKGIIVTATWIIRVLGITPIINRCISIKIPVGAVCGNPVGTRPVIGRFSHVVRSFIYTAGITTGPFIAKLGEFDSIRFLRVDPAQ